MPAGRIERLAFVPNCCAARAERDRRLDALAAEGEHAWVQVTQLIERAVLTNWP